ncbi:Arginase/deacetylase [Melanogaster broomeanus]|nr:Arginase/deacetylase [Melanogaster broomeanus]
MDAFVPSSKEEEKPESGDIVSRGAVAPEVLTEVTTGPSINVERAKHTAVFIQDECLKHRFIRSRDTSGIVERPERLRAVKVGLAAAISRIEEADSAADTAKLKTEGGIRDHGVSTDSGADDLAAALDRMKIAAGSSLLRTSLISIRRTLTTVELLNNPAVKYIHGDIDGDVYLENLISLARDSQENITKKGSEIPEGLPPLDLYLCPGSVEAIQGAIGAVQEAVDAVPCERAFVAIRPPGHHCGEDTPSGFCFVNNIAIGAAHAHLNHGIPAKRTQSIAWQINEETYRQSLESELSPGDTPPAKPGPRIYYGSLHDILSLPLRGSYCGFNPDGKQPMVQAASTSIHGAHGQYIENIHLQRYDSDAHFWDVLYPLNYLPLLHRAREFLDGTGGPGDDVMIFISTNTHRCPGHDRKVPVSFYHRFTRDACTLADTYARGGYSDRALTSGGMAHLCGLVDIRGGEGVSNDWLEKTTKPRKASSRPSLIANSDEWLSRTVESSTCSRTLRERKQPNSSSNDGLSTSSTGTTDPVATARKGGSRGTKQPVKSTSSPPSSIADMSSTLVSDNTTRESSQSAQEDGEPRSSSGTGKKLPKSYLTRPSSPG